MKNNYFKTHSSKKLCIGLALIVFGYACSFTTRVYFNEWLGQPKLQSTERWVMRAICATSFITGVYFIYKSKIRTDADQNNNK